MEYNTITLPSKTRKISENATHGVYEINNLYPGYGHTLGNVLRRILLSSIQGAAVTKITFDTVSHEFTTVEGVREDILSVVLNLKKLRVRVNEGVDSVVGVCKKNKVGILSSGDIDFSAQAEVVDKDLHIAEITDKSGYLGFEVHVETGHGFLSQDDVKMDQKRGYRVVKTDALFSPIHLVNYTVSNMRVGNRSDFNILQIAIQTDGTISPGEALISAIQTLTEQMKSIAQFQVDPGKEIQDTPDSNPKKKVLIDSLELPPSLSKVLIEHGVQFGVDLKNMGVSKILEIPGVGEKAIVSIRTALAEHGLMLKD